MKYIITICVLIYSFSAYGMIVDKKERRKSASPSFSSALVSKHKRSSSLTDKVLMKLKIKTDDDNSITVAALVTERRTKEEADAVQKDEEAKKNCLSRSDSRNYSARAEENNLNNFTKAKLLSYNAIKEIQEIDDVHCKQYRSNLKQARYYFICWMSLKIPQHSWVVRLADEELKPIQEEFDKKIALLKEAQKK